MADAAKAANAAEVAGSAQAAAARGKDIASIQQEAQALSQLANAAKQSNVQLLYGGRNDMTAHLSDLSQELNYTTLLNRQKWLGFSSVQQAMSYRQQMYNLALLENKAHFAGYLTADQYLGFLQREIADTAALSAVIRTRTAAIAGETSALLAHANALQGTRQTAGSLGEQLAGAAALNATITGIPSLVVTRAEFEDSAALAELAAYRAALNAVPHAETTDIISAATRLGGVPLTGLPPIQAGQLDVSGIRYTGLPPSVPVRAQLESPLTVGDPMVQFKANMAAAANPQEMAEAILTYRQARDALQDVTQESDALGASLDELGARDAVAAASLGKFADSAVLAAVDTRALEQGIDRMAAVEQMLPGVKRLSEDWFQLWDIMQAVNAEELSAAPVERPLSRQLGLPEAAADARDLADEMEVIEGKVTRPPVDASEIEGASGEIDYLAEMMSQFQRKPAHLAIDSGEVTEGVTKADLLANEMTHLNERASRLGVDFSQVEEARLAEEALGDEMHDVGTTDTVINVDASGAVTSIEDVTHAEEAADDRLQAFVQHLTEAARDKYAFAAQFDDAQALAEANRYMGILQEIAGEEDKVTAGMGGAAGGGGGGGPPVPVAGGAGEPNPDDPAAYQALIDELNQVAAAQMAVGRTAATTGEALANVGKQASLMVDPLVASTGGWFGLNSQLRVFGGLVPGLTGTVSALHVLIDFIIEGLAVFIPAIVTAAAGLTAFGIAGSDAGKAVYERLMAVHTASDALDATIPPMTGHLEQLHDQVRPQVWELYGDAIDVVHNKTGLFNQLAVQTGDVVDHLAARLSVDLMSGGQGLKTFFTVGAENLAKLGTFFSNLGQALLAFIKVTQETHVDQIFLNIFVALSQLLVLVTKLPTPLLAAAVGLHAFYLWGGLLATVVLQLLNPLRSLALALGAVDAASVEGGLASLAESDSAWARLKAGLTDIAAGFGALPARLGLVSSAARDTETALGDVATAAEDAGGTAAEAASGGGGFAALLSKLNIFSGSAKETTTAAEDVGTATEDMGAAATEAAAGGGGLVAMLGRLAPALTNPYVAVGLLAAALAGAGVYLATLPDATQKWVASLNQALAKTSAFTVVSQTVGDLAAVTNELALAQSKGVGNATELASAQQGLSADLGNELTHVGQVSKAYGTDFVGALELLNAAGVKTSDIFDAQGKTWAADLQQVQGLVDGYKAMGQGMSELQNDVSVQLVNESDQVTAMGKLNQAWDTFRTAVSGPVDSFLALDQSMISFQQAASQTGASMSGLGNALPVLADQTKTLSNAAINLQQQFQSTYSATESMFDAFRSAQALNGGQGNFTQFVKDAVAALLPLAGSNKAAAAEISQLAQEAGGPGTTSLQALAKWAGNVKDPMLALYNASELATEQTASLSQDAAKLTSTLQQDLNPAMATAVFNAHGGQAVFNAFADALAKTGPSSQATATAAHNVAAELLAVSGNSANAKANFVGFAEAMGLGAKQANALWAQVTAIPNKKTVDLQLSSIAVTKSEIAKLEAELPKVTGTKKLQIEAEIKQEQLKLYSQNVQLARDKTSDLNNQSLSKLRGQLAATASSAAQLGTPGTWGQIEHFFMAFWDGIFDWFKNSLPHAFEAAWDAVFAWFSGSVPHGLEAAWKPVASFFGKAFTHDIPEAWDAAWAHTLSPVTHAFDSVKTWVAANFDKWWKTHGSAVEDVWKAVWGQIRSDAEGAWRFIESDATTAWHVIETIVTGAWHVITGIFTSGPAMRIWSFVSSGASAAWNLAVSTAKASWAAIEGIAKAAWAVVAGLAKAAWSVISNLTVGTAKAMWAVVEASAKVLWDQVVALAKIAWDTIVLVVDEVLDVITGHWSTAWKDMESYGIQVWNAIRTAAEQTWNAISTAAVQVWNAIWNAVKSAAGGVWDALKTGGGQAWNAIWGALQAALIKPMDTFFTSTIPGWWNYLVSLAVHAWSSVWSGFVSSVIDPIENFFTSTLPNAITGGISSALNGLAGPINSALGTIKSALSFIPGLAGGGVVHMAAGAPVRMSSGSVPGTGDEDGTAIVAMGGEYMIRKSARMALQAAYGPEFLEWLNMADVWLKSGSRGNQASQKRTTAHGFIAAGGHVPAVPSVATMFSGGMAAGGLVPGLTVPGLSATLTRQLSATAANELPRTLSEAGGDRIGLSVGQLNINNPRPEKPSDSITRASNRLAVLAGRGVL